MARVGSLVPAVPRLTKRTWSRPARWGRSAWEGARAALGMGVIAGRRFEGCVPEAFLQVFMLISL